MTALLEIKQNIKGFYGRYEVYMLPVLKFALAFVYFMWISTTLDFSQALGSIFVVLILALLCAILPTNSIIWIGFVLIIGQCYVLSVEVAALALVLIILMLILFLRFSPDANLALLFTPIGFSLRLPMAVPVGSGLLGGPLTAAPAASGVILNYFIRTVKEQEALLRNEETDIPQKLKIVLDGLMKNQEMWMAVTAFVIVVLLVYFLRTRSMDYAWRIAIIVGVVTYAFIMFAGGLFLDAVFSVPALLIGAVVVVIFGLLLEFFAFGGDYTRTELLEFEDDDYFYYVKAVPKASVSTSARKIRKINGTQKREVVFDEEPKEEVSIMKDGIQVPENTFVSGDASVESESVLPQLEVDFEKKLEESLKDL